MTPQVCAYKNSISSPHMCSLKTFEYILIIFRSIFFIFYILFGTCSTTYAVRCDKSGGSWVLSAQKDLQLQKGAKSTSLSGYYEFIWWKQKDFIFKKKTFLLNPSIIIANINHPSLYLISCKNQQKNFGGELRCRLGTAQKENFSFSISVSG